MIFFFHTVNKMTNQKTKLPNNSMLNDSQRKYDYIEEKQFRFNFGMLQNKLNFDNPIRKENKNIFNNLN